jgi:hypothetical protein
MQWFFNNLNRLFGRLCSCALRKSNQLSALRFRHFRHTPTTKLRGFGCANRAGFVVLVTH